LFIRGARVSDTGLKAIARMTRLRHLIFDSMSTGRGQIQESLDGPVVSEATSHVTVEGIRALSQIRQLKTLDLGGFYISTSNANVDVNLLTQTIVETVATLPNLQDLGLRHWTLSSNQVDVLMPAIRRLKRLNIYGWTNSGRVLEHIDNGWPLEALSVTDIRPNGLQHILRLPGLRQLQITSPYLTGEQFRQLGESAHLEVLQISGRQLNIGDLNAAISRLAHLRELVYAVNSSADAAPALVSITLPPTVSRFWLGGVSPAGLAVAVSEFSLRYPSVTLTVKSVAEPLWESERRRLFDRQ
jgi:hypothetical protein